MKLEDINEVNNLIVNISSLVGVLRSAERENVVGFTVGIITECGPATWAPLQIVGEHAKGKLQQVLITEANDRLQRLNELLDSNYSLDDVANTPVSKIASYLAQGPA